MQIFIKFIFVLGQMSCELLWWCIIYSFDIVNFFLVYSETCMVMVPDWHYPQKFLHNCLMWYMARNTIFVVFVKKTFENKNKIKSSKNRNYFKLFYFNIFLQYKYFLMTYNICFNSDIFVLNTVMYSICFYQVYLWNRKFATTCNLKKENVYFYTSLYISWHFII